MNIYFSLSVAKKNVSIPLATGNVKLTIFQPSNQPFLPTLKSSPLIFKWRTHTEVIFKDPYVPTPAKHVVPNFSLSSKVGQSLNKSL